MKREPIKLERVDLIDFVEDWSDQIDKNEIEYRNNLKVVNIRGCNGSGKSSIPLQMLGSDLASFIFTVDGKDRATVFPNFGYVAIGRYRTKTGGMDGISTKDEKQELLNLLWKTPFDIIMEGVIDSTIYSTYLNLFKECERRNDPKRKIGILNLLPPLEVALERIQKRNGGKKIKEDAVASKWNTVNRNADKFKNEGLNSWKADNSEIELKDTLSWFKKQIKKNM